MSLSDCEKCWDTPCGCGCGYGYRDWSPKKLREQIAMLEKVLAEKVGPSSLAVLDSHIVELIELLKYDGKTAGEGIAYAGETLETYRERTAK